MWTLSGSSGLKIVVLIDSDRLTHAHRATLIRCKL